MRTVKVLTRINCHPVLAVGTTGSLQHRQRIVRMCTDEQPQRLSGRTSAIVDQDRLCLVFVLRAAVADNFSVISERKSLQHVCANWHQGQTDI